MDNSTYSVGRWLEAWVESVVVEGVLHLILHANLIVPVLHVDAGVVDLLKRVQRLAILSLYAQNRRVAKLEALVAKYLIVRAAESVLHNHFGAFLVGR